MSGLKREARGDRNFSKLSEHIPARLQADERPSCCVLSIIDQSADSDRSPSASVGGGAVNDNNILVASSASALSDTTASNMIMDNLETMSFAESSNVVHFQHLLHFESSFISSGGGGGGGGGNGTTGSSGNGNSNKAEDGLTTPTVASAAAAASIVAGTASGSAFPILRRSEPNIFNDSLNTPISSFMDLPVFFSSTMPTSLAAVLPPPSVLEAGKNCNSNHNNNNIIIVAVVSCLMT